MATIERVRLVLNGFVGGPGVITLYALDGAALTANVATYCNNIAGAIPDNVTMHCEGSGDILNDQTGEITGTWTGGTVTPHAGTSAATFPVVCGWVVNWITGTVLDGKRLKGRSFHVPAAGGIYDTNGQMVTASAAANEAVAQALVAAATGNFVVWHRPRKARAADGTRPAVTARLGGHAFVTDAFVPDKVAVLRSRRD
jgi:hypothetical protein